MQHLLGMEGIGHSVVFTYMNSFNNSTFATFDKSVIIP